MAEIQISTKKKRKTLQGIVVSNKMQKTIVVRVDRHVKHNRYLKYVHVSKKYKAHDEQGQAKVGNRVEIIESKPISKEKRWVLRRVMSHSIT